MLAAMDLDAAGGDLDTLRDLCAGLASLVGDGELLAWAGAGDAEEMAAEVSRWSRTRACWPTPIRAIRSASRLTEMR